VLHKVGLLRKEKKKWPLLFCKTIWKTTLCVLVLTSCICYIESYYVIDRLIVWRHVNNISDICMTRRSLETINQTFVEDPVPRQESEWSCLCLLGYRFYRFLRFVHYILHTFRQWYFSVFHLIIVCICMAVGESFRLPQLPQQIGNILDLVGKHYHGNWSPTITPDILLLNRRCYKLSFTYKEHDVFHKRCIRLLFIELCIWFIPHDQSFQH